MAAAADASSALSVRQKVHSFLNSARTGNLDLFKRLAAELDDGKGLARTVEDVKDANKRTALHFAAREGKMDVCRYLLEDLELGVDVRDEFGETPLIHASRQGHVVTAKYLLERGADPSSSSELGATPLHHAAGNGNIELLNLLLSKGVDVDSLSDSGTPLVWAAGLGKLDSVKILLEHSANPNSETDDNITPLFSSVAAKSLPCVKLLIEAGAKANVIAGGTTTLHVAADTGNKDIVNCLLKAGGDPNEFDEDGLIPIQIAAASENRDIVTILLPSTNPLPNIPDWNVDGLIQYSRLEMKKEQHGHMTPQTQELMDASTTKISEITLEAKDKCMEAKLRGLDAFRRKDYLGAIEAYTEAINLDPSEHTLLSNRSLCWMRTGQADNALADAQACRALKPDWPKACYREGSALQAMQRFDEAASAFYEGVKLDPENKELLDAFRDAVECGRRFHGTDKQKQ